LADVEVGILVTFDDRRVKKGAERSSKAVKSFADRAQRAFKGLKSAFGAVGLAVTALNQGIELAQRVWGAFKTVTVDAAAAVFDFASASAAMSDAALELGRRTGTSAEFISQMGFAARQADVTTEQLRVGLVALTRRASAMPKNFERWGVSVRDVNGNIKDTQTLVLEVADRMERMGSAAQKAAFGDDVLSEAGRQLVPLLEQGSAGLQEMFERADQLGITVSNTSALIADEFNNQMTAASDATQALKRNIGDVLLPILTVFLKRGRNVAAMMSRWIKANRALIDSGLNEFLIFVAEVGIPAVTAGVTTLIQSWALFRQAIVATRQIFEGMVLGVATGLKTMLDPLLALAERFGPDGLAGKIGEARIAIDTFQKTAKIAFDESTKEANKLFNEALDLSEKLAKLGDSGSVAIREILFEARDLVAEMANLGNQTVKTTRDIQKADDEAFKAFLARRDAEIAAVQRLTAARRRAQAMTDKADKANAKTAAAIQEKRREDEQKTVDKMTEASVAIGASFGEAIGRAQTLGDVAKNTAQEALGLAKQWILAEAAKAAAASFSAHAGIPFVGLALGAAAAAAALTAVSAFVGSFQFGGTVPETGFALVHKDEEIIPAATAQATGQRGGGGGGTTIINAPMQLLATPNQVRVDQHFQDSVMPAVERAEENRRTRRGRGRRVIGRGQ
jgi:hypothetical protein